MKWPWVSRWLLERAEREREEYKQAWEALKLACDNYEGAIGTLRAEAIAHKQDIRTLTVDLEETRATAARYLDELQAFLSEKYPTEHKRVWDCVKSIYGDKYTAVVAAAQLRKEEIVSLKAELAQLRDENEQYRKAMPAFKPKRVRWSGPGGVRSQAEAADRQQSEAERLQKATEAQREEVTTNGNG